MEAAIVEYIEEYERCELLCEGRYDHEAFPELYNSIGGNCLTCMIVYVYCIHTNYFSFQQQNQLLRINKHFFIQLYRKQKRQAPESLSHFPAQKMKNKN